MESGRFDLAYLHTVTLDVAAVYEAGGQTVKSRSLLILVLFLAGSLVSPLRPARAAGALELYGTFHAMGVIVTIGTGDDPDQDAIANVKYRASGSGESFRPGYPLSRVSSTRFVGSLFWLEPGTTYDVGVTFTDADGALGGVSLSASGATRDEIVIPTPDESFYVSPGGVGTACSPVAPCALVEGLNQAGPGDAVILRGGVYYEGEILLPYSGTPSAPIVIQSYPGEMAVLDGADPATFAWTAQGGGVYHTTVKASDPHLVLANGERLYPYHSLADLQSLRWGIPGFYADGTALYVRLEGNADPNGVAMVVSRYRQAVQVQRDRIYFLNLTFRHYGQGAGARAIRFENGNDNLVQGCTFAVNDTALVIGSGSQRNVIQDSQFYDTIFDWPWDAVKDGSGLEAGGIRFNYPTTPRGTVIRRNVFHDYFDGFNACPNETTGTTNETDVYDNLVFNTGDDGMQADGQCSNVRIWDNTIHDVLTGVSLAPAQIGPVYAVRNLVYRTGISSFKFNFDGGQSGPMYLFHNTCDAVLPDVDGLWIGQPGVWKLLYARNNVWAGTAFALKDKNTSQPVDLDYSDLWNGENGDLVRWGSTSYATVADLASATGQEPHGLSVAPGFADAESGDYTLDPTSDLIDAGVVIPGINDSYVGAAPDMGAFEYEGYGFILTASPPSCAIAPGGVGVYTIGVRPAGGFTSTVNLVSASPSPNLSLELVPTTVVPPGWATLTITDSHTGTLLPGVWYSVPITATFGEITQVTSVNLLVGGVRVYLPVVLRQ